MVEVSETKGRDTRSVDTPGPRFSFELLATSDDRMGGLVALAKAAHEESRLSYIIFAPHKVEAIVRKALADTKRHGIMLCKDHGLVVGAAYCSVGEYHVGAGTLVTTIHNINVLPEKRRGLSGGKIALGLMRGIETWSQARKSKEIFFHVTSDVDLVRTHKFIKRLGYQFIGGSYAKRIGTHD